MLKNTDLFESVVDTYAKQIQLTLIISNEQGEKVITSKPQNKLCHTLLQQGNDRIQAIVSDILVGKEFIKQPMVCEVWPGIYTIIAPIHRKHNPPYYLWAGLMVKKETKSLVLDRLTDCNAGKIQWENILNETPKLTANNKQLWLNKLDHLVQLMSVFFTWQETPSTYEVQHEILQKAFTGRFNLDDLFRYYLNKNDEIEFLGLTQQFDDDTQKITHIIGEEAGHLLNMNFTRGQGFLGRIQLTQIGEIWEDIEKDPRTYYFHKHNFYPKSLFCFPIRQENGQ